MARPRASSTSGPSSRVEVTAQAADLAIDVARRDALDELAPTPPTVLRPILAWRRGARAATARAAGLSALDDDEFRRRVAEAATALDLDEASRLVLERPEGWEQALVAIETEFATRGAVVELARVRGELRERGEDVARAQAESAELRRELDRCRRELADRSTELEAKRDEVARLGATTERLTAERQAAVRDLKRLEKRLAERTNELHALRTQPEGVHEIESTSGSEPTDALEAWADRLRASQLDLLARHRVLGDAIDALMETLGVPEPPVTLPKNTLPSNGGVERAAPTRRRPVRLARGLTAASVEGVRWLLNRPGVQVLIDGYNVTMTAWPSLSGAEQRDRLETACAVLGAVTGAVLTIVFDGVGSGGRPARSVGSDVRVRFAAESSTADDELLALIPTVPLDQPVVVVSSDRRVAEGATALGAIAVSSAVFAEVLRG